MLFEQADQRIQSSDPVFEEDGELGNARALEARALFGLWRKDFFHRNESTLKLPRHNGNALAEAL
jgi:hypothetical protein